MRLMNVNYCSEASTNITASSSSPYFPSSNLKNPIRSKRWRSTGCANENIVFDFQTTESVNSVVVLWTKEDGIKLTGAATLKIQANATNVWTSPAVDQVLTIDNDYSVASHNFTTDQNYRYWRVVIQDSSNPWGYIEIGKIWIGKSLEVENAENGFVYSLVDQSKNISNDFGHSYVDEYPTLSVLEINYSYLEYESQKILENAFRQNGNRKPILMILDPEENVFSKNHFLIYGKMQSKFSTKHVRYKYSNVDLVIEELA